MTTFCNAHIRPMPDDTQIDCEMEGEHFTHRGVLRDYAHPGSVTQVDWEEEDRRTFHGEWPGECSDPGCVLPAEHQGGHAT